MLTTTALTTCIVRLVNFSRRMAWLVVILAIVISAGLGCYAATHFKINTDINKLLSDHLDWRKREADLEKAFPQKNDLILIAIDGDTPDAAENAASALYAKLQAMPERFTFVQRPDAIPFFQKNGILFLSKDEITGALSQMIEAQPLLGMLASDPSLRGFFGTIGLMLQGVQAKQVSYDQLDAPIGKIADTVEAAVAGQDKPLEWQSMAAGPKPTLRELRKFIIAKPVLNFGALEPGQAATTAIRDLVQQLNLNPDHGVHVRLTGPVPLNDEEFASVASGTGIATILSGALVFVILLVALRSLKIVLPIIFTLIVGLIATTAFALAAVGSLNLISVAFAVMFIGIAVDFGIQFGVRYRDQHHIEPDHAKAMSRTATIIAIPLAMAAASTALGFLAFIPTAYRGVSELGLIAGFGMVIAFFLNITLLPALLTLTRPPAEAEAIGFSWAAPIDTFITHNRRAILAIALLLGIVGVGITTKLHFDFDPLNLKDTHTESVSTLFDLMQDPDFNSYTIDILTPSLADADALATKLQTLPQVDHAMTLSSFVPEDQDAKLAMINDSSAILTPSLSLPALPPPTDGDIIDTIKKTADALHPLANEHPTAARLAKALDAVIANPSKDVLDRLQHNLVDVLQAKLVMVKHALGAEHVSPDTMTDDLRRDWVTPDNRYLVEVYPKGNPRDHDTLVAFTDAVRQVAPEASGSPISIREGGNTVTAAFVQAGIYAIITIALLAFFILRRVRDVAIMLAPLFLAGVLTLATIVLIKLPLNFANIIALPLLLSLGVSYAIYFVSYWRSGLEHPLQSSMARAVLFSAATVLIAFSSLALSSHPGTSGMGKLLTLALVYSLLCTFFVLPALCGSPKPDKH